MVSLGSGPEKSLALQCWGPKRLNQDGDFEVELKDLGNPSLGGGSKHEGAEGPAVSKKQWRRLVWESQSRK